MRRAQLLALALGAAGLGACILGAARSPARFFQGYLFGYLCFCGLALGCLGLLMMNHLTGGAWGLFPRRVLESAALTLPLLLVLFGPLLFGLRWLYPWARPEQVAQSPLLQHKHLYLNVPFFLLRAGTCFALWIGMAALLWRGSRRQGRPGADPVRLAARMRVLSGPGLVIYAITVDYAYIDWVMSLRPEWYSTIFGMIVVAGQGLSGLAFVILVLALRRTVPAPARVLHDLGKLLLAFVLLWAYTSFSQFLIIWSGDLPQEIGWYLPRLRGGWQYLGLLLIVGHFAVPFVVLLSRELKRHAAALAAAAVFLLGMRMVDLYWMTAPGLDAGYIAPHWTDLAAILGIGGLWVACFCWLLGRGPELPLGAPYLDLALKKEE